jgi:hypothetical protein
MKWTVIFSSVKMAIAAHVFIYIYLLTLFTPDIQFCIMSLQNKRLYSWFNPMPHAIFFGKALYFDKFYGAL